MSGMDIDTIGHSNHAIDQFIELLKQHDIEALVDVRRFPMVLWSSTSLLMTHWNRTD